MSGVAGQSRHEEKSQAEIAEARSTMWENCLHYFCAFVVCKMLELSILQSLEQIISVETPAFSTEIVEKVKRHRDLSHLTSG